MHRPRPALTAGLLSAGLLGASLVMSAPAQAAPEQVSGAVLEWTGNAEMQATQPASPEKGAPACSYFSAGISAPYVKGSGQPSYRASLGNVSIRKASGLASWATRCAGVTSKGDVHQTVVVGGGAGTVDPVTGATTIQWTGSWSVNFYGGMIPFSITDPRLVVGPDGRGTITATMGGYEGEIGSADVTPIASVPSVVIANLSGVASKNRVGFVTTPAYVGVRYDALADSTPQNRSTPGWGSWPTSYVDFHVKTGLDSYWYTSGGGADAKKAPTPIVVKYANVRAASTATIKTDKKKIRLGQKVKLKVVVRAAGVPVTGTATVRDRKKVVTTVALTSGKAKVKLKNLAKGKHKFWVAYPGSSLLQPSTSPKVVVKVKKR